MKIFTLLLACTTVLSAHATKDYIKEYLPDNSLIKKIHLQEPHGTGWFGYDSSLRKSCDYLNNLFEAEESKEPTTFARICVYTQRLFTRTSDDINKDLEAAKQHQISHLMDQAVDTILAKESPEIRKKELLKIYQARTKIREQVDK